VPTTSYQNSLEITIKRKSKQVEAALQELGMEGLEERLSSATQNPASPAYRLTRLIAETTQMQGRAVIVVEVTRPTPATTPQQLANIAKTAIQCGADALCVRLDTEDTPQVRTMLDNTARHSQLCRSALSSVASQPLPGEALVACLHSNGLLASYMTLAFYFFKRSPVHNLYTGAHLRV
jgi:hypothetical protein